MIKQLQLTKQDLDVIKKTVEAFEHEKSFLIREERRKSFSRNCLNILLDYGFKLKSSSTIDCDGVNYFAQIRVEYNERIDLLSKHSSFFWSGSPKEGNEYCPDGSPRIEGYTHKLNVNNRDLHVLKWRDSGDLMVFIDIKCKAKTFSFVHPFFGTKASVTFMIFDGKLSVLDYDIGTDVNREILRDREARSYERDRINYADERLRDWTGSCKPACNNENVGQSEPMTSFIKDYFDNLANGFAARYFDAVKKHGITSNDAKREFDIAVKALAYADQDISEKEKKEHEQQANLLLDDCYDELRQ